MRLSVSIATGFSCLSLCSVGQADDRRAGITALVQGGALYQARDYEGARQAFARAYDLEPSAGTLFDLALAELQSGRSADSGRHLRAYLGRSDAQADKSEAIRTRWLPQAQARVAHVRIQACPGVEILADGVRIGITPTDDLDIDGGQHTLVARKGQWSQKVTVIVRAGDSVPMNVEVPESVLPPRMGQEEHVDESSAVRAATEISLASSGAAAAAGAIAFAVAARRTSGGERAREDDVALALALSAGVLATGASVAWLAWPNAMRRDGGVGAHAAPQLGSDGVGVSITGAF
ncbi:MAG: hypothetical protein ABTD50_14335 [Polyangiaceae bacterium]|jgi:tetratricopeptide (TPR) repeat protein